MPKKYRHCCVPGCNNNTFNSTVYFFKIPSEDIKWSIHWLKKIGRLDLTNADLKSESVCEIHFEREYFKTPKTLYKRAIPTLHLCETTLSAPPQNLPSKLKLRPTQQPLTPSVPDKLVQQATINPINPVQTLLCYQVPQQNDIESYVVEVKSEISSENSEGEAEMEDNFSQEKETLDTIPDISQEKETLDTIPDEMASVVHKREIIGRFDKLIWLKKTIQKKFKSNRKSFLFKLMALNLRILSPQTYRSLREILNLPTERVLRQLNLNFSTKVDSRMLQIIVCKLKSLPDKAKHCTLCIGRMHLKKNVYYNIKRDRVVGLENVCENITVDIAGYVYVAVVRGVLVDWKLPIAYSFFKYGNNFHSLESWTLDVITALLQIGIEIKALVSNPECNFKFGYRMPTKDINTSRAFCNVGNRTIPFIFNVPHLFRRIRNDFMQYYFVDPPVDISHKYILEAFDHKFHSVNLLPDLTKHYIYPENADKLRMDYVAKLFSRTVYTALQAYIFMKYLPEKATQTADFILLMNDLFDVLNSSEAGGSSNYQKPFRFSEDQMEVLDRASQRLKHLMILTKSRTSVCKYNKNFKYLYITISSIISVCKELRAEGVDGVYTRRLNLEPLDECFEEIRKEVGRKKMAAHKFERAFSKLVIRYALKVSHVSSLVLDPSDYMSLCPIPSSSSSPKPEELGVPSNHYRIVVPDNNGSLYVASYLFFSCSSVHSCEEYQIAHSSCPLLNDIFNYFKLFNKESMFYGELRVPPDSFYKYIKQLEVVSMELLSKAVTKNPAILLMESLPPFVGICKCFPAKFLLKLFIRLKIYASCKVTDSYFRGIDKQLRFVKTRESFNEHLEQYKLLFRHFT